MTAMARFVTFLHVLTICCCHMPRRPTGRRCDLPTAAGRAGPLRAGQALAPRPMVVTAAFGGRTYTSSPGAGLAKG
jgi:hypothetical protein